MAKASGLTAVDKYIEKGVAAACGLVLVYALFQWGFSSPREFVGKGGEKMPPAQIDGWLKRQAEDAQRRVNDFKPAGTSMPDYVAALTAISKNASGNKYAMSFDLTDARIKLAVPTAPSKKTFTLAELEASMLAPLDKPQVKAVWVLPQKENATDVCVVNGIVAYPYMDLIKQWNEKFHTSFNMIFTEQVVEVQEQNTDGSWGAVRQAKLAPLPFQTPSGSAVVVPELPAYDGRNAKAVQDCLTVLSSDEYQQSVLQPEYPAVYWPRPSQWVSWRANLPPSDLSDGRVQIQGTPVEIAVGPVLSTTAGAVAPVTAAPVVAPPVAAQPVARPAPTPSAGPQIFRPHSADAEPQIFRPHSADAAGGAAATAAPAPVPPSAAPSPVTPTAAAPVNPALPSMPAEPAYAVQRDEKGRILAWFSDSSLVGGKTYRFRVRFKLVNPLLACDGEVKDPQDARKPFIYTPWSQWSAPVAAPDSAQIFLSGASMNTAQVKIFTRAFGQVVKQDGSVLPGDAIGHEEEVKVANPLAARMEQKKVGFNTGCVVVALNFDKPVFRGNSSKKTLEIVYLDAAGQLQSRFQDADKDSKTYKELDALLTPAAAAATPGSPAVVPVR